MQACHEYTFFFCSPEASATKLGGGVWTGGGGGSRCFCFCINRWEQRATAEQEKPLPSEALHSTQRGVIVCIVCAIRYARLIYGGAEETIKI